MKYYEVVRSADSEEMELYDDVTGKLIMKGDQYHNKIESQIEGFFNCLGYLSITYECRYTDQVD